MNDDGSDNEITGATAMASIIDHVIAEHAETVRGEARYFLVAATDEGVIEATITRDSDQGRKGHRRDAWTQARIYDPTHERSWRFVASLGYDEMATKDIPCHGDISDWMNRLRADAENVVDRAVAILKAARGLPAERSRR